MGDSRKKYEELNDMNIEVSDRSGIGFFHQTTTQDNFEEDILDEYFVKSDETLMGDLVEEFRNWNYQWESWRPDGIYPKPIDADQFAKELSKKYKISEKC